MRVLESLEPKNVFYFFEEICNIPHGSGNTEKISSYLEQFAKKRELEHYRDELGNIIIIKEASPGYEEHEPVILQGHMDMVAVKTPDCDIDMKTDGLRLAIGEDKIFARGTSLGGDDGIALAYGLALLDGDYRHPRIELVITVDEEVGMDGARALDITPLTAKRMINLDSEEEGVFWAGCAGGARVDMTLAGSVTVEEGALCEVKIFGLQGGHSGAEIHRERGNGICLLGRVLHRLAKRADFCIRDVKAGVADNAIPVSARAELILTGYQKRQETLEGMQESRAAFLTGVQEEPGAFEGMPEPRAALEADETAICLQQLSRELTEELREELSDKDPGVQVEIQLLQKERSQVFSAEDSRRAAAFLGALPYGVQAMSFAVPGLVETSLNPGLLSRDKDKIKIGISVRSSLNSAKRALIYKLEDLSCLAGAEMKVSGDYPGWAYRKESPLREKMVRVYQELFDKKPSVEAVHAGLECGILTCKIPGLDCVSIGPDMKNIHTTEEELSISSTVRVWNYLVKLLENL